MEAPGMRRSDRIYVEIPIRVSGSDVWGLNFADETKTMSINRHGAKIMLNRALGPEQKLTIYYKATGAEVSARVVGKFGEDPRGSHYGIEFLDLKASPWGVDFPLADSEYPAARALLECGRCHSQEVVYLTEMEAQIFDANRGLTRPCKSCVAPTVWIASALAEPGESTHAAGQDSQASPQTAQPSAQAPQNAIETPPVRTQNDRKHVRVKVRMTMCIRHPQFGEEILSPENISRGGVCFISRKVYGLGTNIEIALPYTKDGASIFSHARIVQAKELPKADGYRYGAQYIANAQHPPEDRNLRIITHDN
jgi:PilZ domain-containing protein